MPRPVFHSRPIGLPDLGHCGVDPVLYRLGGGAVVPGHPGEEPDVGDLIGARVNAEKHGVGQIEEAGVVRLEAQAVQRVVDQNDQCFALHFFNRRTPNCLSGPGMVVGRTWEGGAARSGRRPVASAAGDGRGQSRDQ